MRRSLRTTKKSTNNAPPARATKPSESKIVDKPASTKNNSKNEGDESIFAKIFGTPASGKKSGSKK